MVLANVIGSLASLAVWAQHSCMECVLAIKHELLAWVTDKYTATHTSDTYVVWLTLCAIIITSRAPI